MKAAIFLENTPVALEAETDSKTDSRLYIICRPSAMLHVAEVDQLITKKMIKMWA